MSYIYIIQVQLHIKILNERGTSITSLIFFYIFQVRSRYFDLELYICLYLNGYKSSFGHGNYCRFFHNIFCTLAAIKGKTGIKR